jgi:hypothetical protein
MALGMASGLALGMPSEMASVCSEIVSGMKSEQEMELASGMVSETKLIDRAHLFRGDPQCVFLSSSQLFTGYVSNGRDSRPGGVLS